MTVPQMSGDVAPRHIRLKPIRMLHGALSVGPLYSSVGLLLVETWNSAVVHCAGMYGVVRTETRFGTKRKLVPRLVTLHVPCSLQQACLLLNECYSGQPEKFFPVVFYAVRPIFFETMG